MVDLPDDGFFSSHEFMSFHRRLVRYAAILGAQEPEDIVQDAYVICAARLADVQPGARLTFARNAVFWAFCQQRRGKRRAMENDLCRTDRPDLFESRDDCRAAELQLDIEYLVATLPSHLKQTYELQVQGYTQKEMAEQLAVSERCVRYRLCRIRAFLENNEVN
ncbi:MAG: hypothetical protein KDB27_30370 [Planctomycetales bacterium]|nr:hypothetical protein [Planctomycetales bacterium]